MTDLVDSVRMIVRGYHAAHTLAAERAAGSLAGEWELDVAAEFGLVAELLDKATVRVPRSYGHSIRTLDGGAYVEEVES
jgi:hypothetical protein